MWVRSCGGWGSKRGPQTKHAHLDRQHVGNDRQWNFNSESHVPYVATPKSLVLWCRPRGSGIVCRPFPVVVKHGLELEILFIHWVQLKLCLVSRAICFTKRGRSLMTRPSSLHRPVGGRIISVHGFIRNWVRRPETLILSGLVRVKMILWRALAITTE